ncbi:MAG TPA: hypothetical protein VGC56_11880 [Allosphingosinicella sp.]
MRRLRAALLALAASAGPAAAQPPAIVSPGPEAIAVTVYRDPMGGGPMDPTFLSGYAFITETRTVRLPAGDSVVRFEGVSGGILPQSAIAEGLPGAPGEKNRDARLISAGSLIEASLGRRVHIRRTDRKTGRVTEMEAVIRSGPGGIVLQTGEGFEALRCTGLPETLVYDSVPAGLTAKPTLAITVHSDAATTATVRLSYLATEFDWRASYVAEVAPDGRTLDLFAWLTLANGNAESFVDARTMAVAGKANGDEDRDTDGPVSGGIELKCWPQGRTNDIPETRRVADILNDLPEADAGSIVVTGSRISRPNLVSAIPITAVVATQEELGDLKLYRIPIPVTVAANSQKQVALLARKAIPFDRSYSASVDTNIHDGGTTILPVNLLLRMKNKREKGLGLPLPEGRVAMFQAVAGQKLVVGESSIGDNAVGQDLELEIGESPDVLIAHRIAMDPAQGDADDRYYNPKPELHELELSNATAAPVTVDVVIPTYEPWEVAKPSRKLGAKDGARLWRAHVPAHGRARLEFTLRAVPKLLRKRPPPDPTEAAR